MAVSDIDGPTNSRPFQCKLINAESASPFSIRTDQTTDECILLVTSSLYLGVRNLLVQVNDNGLTTLYQRVRVVIDVIRLSNIPPEIEPLNASYVYFHSSDVIRKDSEIARVLVRDRSPAYDMLKFELLFNDTKKPQNRYLKNLFKIDAFTGVITTNDQLDSGTYSLDVRVTNGSLSAERTIYIKVDLPLMTSYYVKTMIFLISNCLKILFRILISKEARGMTTSLKNNLSCNIEIISSIQSVA